MQSLFLGLVVIGGLLVGGFYVFNNDKETSVNITNNTENLNGSANESKSPDQSVGVMAVGTYRADTAESSLTWTAGKPAITGYVHSGLFLLDSGFITVTDDTLSGEFIVDINSLRVLSLGGGKDGVESVLESHLKGERFFDTETHPTASFKVLSVEPKILPSPEQTDYTATGELTMKGQTETITFPVKIIVASLNEIWLNATFEVDRTKWGINSGSAKFVDKITDQVIGDMVNMDLTLKLVK